MPDSVHHTQEIGAQDDYPDSTALTELAAASGSIVPQQLASRTLTTATLH